MLQPTNSETTYSVEILLPVPYTMTTAEIVNEQPTVGSIATTLLTTYF